MEQARERLKSGTASHFLPVWYHWYFSCCYICLESQTVSVLSFLCLVIPYTELEFSCHYYVSQLSSFLTVFVTNQMPKGQNNQTG